jgi:2-C-methyl-D-erythritol 4-phosphate cytidylyltransferase
MEHKTDIKFPFVTAIVLAGGKGERFGEEGLKQFVKIAGKRVIEHTLEVLEASNRINEIVVVTHKDYVDLVLKLVANNRFAKVSKVVLGGGTRQQSSWYGLQACSHDTTLVIIHDAARPLVSNQLIEDTIDGLTEAESTDTVIPTADTIVRGEPNSRFIEEIPERSVLYRGQTPQGFRIEVIKRAHEMAQKEGFDGAPDDCSLVLHYGLGRVYLVPGDETNLKITHTIDVFIADRLLQIRSHKLKVKSFDQMQLALRDKTLAIFGGGSGIGKATAEIAKTIGMCVRVWDRDVDVRDYKAVQEALLGFYRETGRIDHVINTAGILRMGYIELAEMELISNQIAVNLLGSINVCKASVSFLRESCGHILLFTSSSYTRGRAGYTAYSASKAGVVNFVQGFSDEVGDYGVKVNCVNPERTKTPMRLQNFGNEEEDELLKAETVAIQSLNILTSSITGSVIDVRKRDEQEILSTFGKEL